MLADDKEELGRHGGHVLVRVGEQGHQPVPHRAPLLRLILTQPKGYNNVTQALRKLELGDILSKICFL